MRQAHPAWILSAFFVYSLAFIARSFRWRYLIEPLKNNIPLKRLFSLLIIGFFMNNVLPLRLGEIVRANISGQRLSITRTGALATILVERLFDGISYIVLFLVTIVFLPFPSWAKTSFSAGAVVFVGALVLLFFLLKHREIATGLMFRLPLPGTVRERARNMFVNFIDGLQIFSKGPALANVFVFSLVVWVIEGSVYYVMGKSFGMSLTLFQCFFVMIIIGMGAILPTAPGFVGTVEFLGVTSLAFLGVNKNLAFGYIITLHMIQLLTVSILGIYAMFSEKVTVTQLVKIEKQL